MQGAGQALRNVLPARELKRLVLEHAGAYRERVYSPLRTLGLFVGQVLSGDGACQDAVARNLSERTARGVAQCTLNTGPYCKARQRLRLGFVRALQRALAASLERQQPANWRWRGRAVKLLDGTTVSMPDTPSNQAAFPQSRNQQPGLGFPLARLVAILSLGHAGVLAWAIGPCRGEQSSEQGLFRRLLDALQPGDLLLADGYHCTYWTLVMLKARGVDVLMHQHIRRKSDFRRGTRLARGDHIVQWSRPNCPWWMDPQTYAAIPESLTVREVRIAGRVLVTTLLDARSVCAAELDRLYASRWNIEVDLRSIKAELGMDVLRCKSPQMVEKEVAIHLLAYTLVRAVMAQAASLAGVLARALSFKAATQVLNAYQQQLRHSGTARVSVMIAHLLGSIATLRLPDRPDRVEPRAVKRRPKPHRLLTIPRDVARRQILARRTFVKVAS